MHYDMKKYYLYLSILLIAVLLSPVTTRAQITVVPGCTAATLANKLVGPGVIIISPTLNCPSVANGTFAGPSTLSFDSGIVLTDGAAQTTGTVTGCNGPASGFANSANGTPGDAQLSALAGQPTNDACVLEFDFRPVGDTVKFDYVFGSEEYTSFTCTIFNDVFGFFISGPGYASPTNIALVPGTTIPVCINSVNCGPTGGGSLPLCTSMGPGSPFCAYYVNNSTGATISYDGLTATLTAIAHVTPCDTYHLKIGIADAVDDVLDSGVFLKAGSLSSTSLSIKSLGINPADTGFDAQYCVRGCNPGMFIFHNNGSLNDSITIHYMIGGTATNGIDYVTIPDSVTIPAHDSTDTLYIRGLVVPPTGPKVVELYILAPYTCGGLPTIIDSVALTIYDSLYIHINTPDTAICIGQSAYINTSADPVLQVLWSPAATLDNPALVSPTATPSVTTTYTAHALYPGSGCPPSVENIRITVVYPPALNAGPDTQSICLGVPLQLGVTTTPAGAYTYSWSPATYLNSSTIPNPIVTPGVLADVLYYVTVTTVLANCPTTDTFLLHVVPNDFILYNPDTGVCYPAGTYQMRTDGSTEFRYRWTPVGGVSDPTIQNPTITPRGTGTYMLTASYPGCPDMKHTISYSVEHPVVDIITSDTTFCIGSTVSIPVVTYPVDSPYTLSWTPTTDLADPTQLLTSFFSTIPGTYQYFLTITSSLGCTSTDSVTLRTSPPVKVIVDPETATIKYGDQIQLNAINLTASTAGSLFYYWSPDNGTIDNANVNNPIVRPTTNTTYLVVGMSIYGCRDSAYATISIDYTDECLPSAFTPNNDGLNDVFRLCNLHNQRMIEFNVYNRWGQMVYHNSTDPTKGWDGTFNGTPQDIGVYNYEYILEEPSGAQKTYKGAVTLIR